MGIFEFIGTIFHAVAQPVVKASSAADSSLSMATEWIENRAQAQSITDKQSVITETAKTLTELQAELDADEKLAETYKQLEATWRK